MLAIALAAPAPRVVRGWGGGGKGLTSNSVVVLAIALAAPAPHVVRGGGGGLGRD